MSISNRPELYMHLRHDYVFILSSKLTEEQIKALQDDLEALEFNVVYRKEESSGNWLCFVGLHNED